MKLLNWINVSAILLFSLTLFGQKKENGDIRQLIEKYKLDDRGPYKDIRWFCDNGTINLPKEPCVEIGGVQRARYKEEVVELAKTNHVFLGQILSTTSRTDFWDAENNHSRLKQYQVEKFLRAADNGWVLRKGQFYRGAIQVEDEEKWGIDFFELVLKDDQKINANFYLLRLAAKDIPHAGDSDRTQNIRALSKNISDSYPPFMALRTKIHGQPDASDIKASQAFLKEHQSKLNKENISNFEKMIKDMEIVYRPVELSSLEKYLQQIPKESSIREALQQYIYKFKNNDFSIEKMQATAVMLLDIRKNITKVSKGKSRLALIDISLALEDILFKGVGKWQPNSYADMMEKIHFLGKASAGCGYLEIWEWEKIKSQIPLPSAEDLTIQQLVNWHEGARRMVEWGASTSRGVYSPVIDQYGGFEPLVYGFFDDKIRSSILLPLGNTVSDMGNAVAKAANFSNQIFDLSEASSFRGLNPGYALGELVVVTGSADEIEVSKDKIYIFYHPASDLKPVAGIATVTEGNLVSHVQLLARNLGIPNAVLSENNLNDLKEFAGEKVFYAVSNKGTVIMKLEKNMTEEERKLFEVKKRSEEKIEVPVEKIQLENTAVLNMRAVRAKDSGKICGPKAANLGQLKAMFPERVVEGLVIPFGIFRQHMEQPMPNQEGTYWEFLNNTFAKGNKIEDEAEAEKFMLQELEVFRNAIKKITFETDFENDLKQSFNKVLGNEIGKIPVFLRSDTNMEDLKDFTGAGLNLTLFNVLDEDKILQGIRDVWASPYTERSYKWRQKYLLNPENVYPSILIIPSVDVDYSGVLITKGITSGNPNDMTVAFSRGAGGAVDGQAAESYLLTATGENILLSPARESTYRRLPVSGGTSTNATTFEKAILNKKNLEALRALTEEVNRIFPETEGVESNGPYDMELGFQDDKMWLFQIRPFVENKNAKASAYLESITPKLPGEATINTEESLPKGIISKPTNPVSSGNSELENGQINTDSPQGNSNSKWVFYGLLGITLLSGGIFFFMKKNKNNDK